MITRSTSGMNHSCSNKVLTGQWEGAFQKLRFTKFLRVVMQAHMEVIMEGSALLIRYYSLVSFVPHCLNILLLLWRVVTGDKDWVPFQEDMRHPYKIFWRWKSLMCWVLTLWVHSHHPVITIKYTLEVRKSLCRHTANETSRSLI